MSKIKDAMLQAEEMYGEEFHRAMEDWESDKAAQLVFRAVEINGKRALVNVK